MKKRFIFSVVTSFLAMPSIFGLYSVQNRSDSSVLEEYAKQLPEAVQGDMTLIHQNWLLATKSIGHPKHVNIGGQSHEIDEWVDHPNDITCPIRLLHLATPVKSIEPIPCACFENDDLIQAFVNDIAQYGANLVVVAKGDGYIHQGSELRFSKDSRVGGYRFIEGSGDTLSLQEQEELGKLQELIKLQVEAFPLRHEGSFMSSLHCLTKNEEAEEQAFLKKLREQVPSKNELVIFERMQALQRELLWLGELEAAGSQKYQEWGREYHKLNREQMLELQAFRENCEAVKNFKRLEELQKDFFNLNDEKMLELQRLQKSHILLVDKKIRALSKKDDKNKKMQEVARDAAKYFNNLCLNYYSISPQLVRTEPTDICSLFLVLGNSNHRRNKDINPNTHDLILYGVECGSETYCFNTRKDIRDWIYQTVYISEPSLEEKVCKQASRVIHQQNSSSLQESQVRDFLNSFPKEIRYLGNLEYEFGKQFQNTTPATLTYQYPLSHMLCSNLRSLMPQIETRPYIQSRGDLPQIRIKKDSLWPSWKPNYKGELYVHLNIPTFCLRFTSDFNVEYYNRHTIEGCIRCMNRNRTKNPVLILDLRKNHGGDIGSVGHLLECMTGILYEQSSEDYMKFVMGDSSLGNCVASYDGKHSWFDQFAKAKGRSSKKDTLYKGAKIIVLIGNETSNVAAFAAAALKHSSGAILMGQTTGGGGLLSFQEPISYGLSVRCQLEEIGSAQVVEPDICTADHPDSKEYALSWLQGEEGEMWKSTQVFSEASVPNYVAIDSQWVIAEGTDWVEDNTIEIDGKSRTIDRVQTMSSNLSGVRMLHLAEPAIDMLFLPRCCLTDVSQLTHIIDDFSEIVVDSGNSRWLYGIQHTALREKDNALMNSTIISEALGQ